ncbi:hypothetical protein F0310_04610 (plasmid) [Borrelia sp. A-FGy1]|uniref:baseplate J/gp47 family protein n=1 Tax=Borrelia sp. A-FGy1 TaxID=2608247 RepID=UPI0015F700F5|nr:baseplate J/gp47 family protein [Borrelia sp. A-FGy1]QMU99700.1 hypothetical protein F0310_04610 [Borrelia sp. A-FGy1]
MYEEELRQFLSFAEQQKIREVFFQKAADFGINTNSNSKAIPILNLILETKLDIRNETYSIAKNYDIRKSEAPFLDMEACKIGLKRKPARKATLTCKITSNGSGEILKYTKFYYSDTAQTQKAEKLLEYKATEKVKFSKNESKTMQLEALQVGSIYNLEKGKLYTNEIITGLTHLEIANINTKGEDEEDDDTFRTRILREINGLTLRDTISYYKRKLESTELIREVLIKRKGVNNTKFILRPHKETTTIEEMKQLTIKTIAHRYEVLEKIDYDKATKKIIKIKLKKKTDNIDTNICKAKLEKYINSLPMGGTFSLYDMYKTIGQGINILEPKENQTTSENEYWEASITFEN